MKPIAFLSVCTLILVGYFGCEDPMQAQVEAVSATHQKQEKLNQGGLVARYEKIGVTDVGRIKQALSDKGIPDDQMENALGALLKITYTMKQQGDDYQGHPKLTAYMQDDLQLTPEHISLLESMGRRIAHRQGDTSDKAKPTLEERYATLGVTDMGVLKTDLLELGIPETQLGGSLRGLLRMIYGMQKQGEAYELHPRMSQYLTEQVELTDAQIAQLHDVAERMAAEAQIEKPIDSE
jgi:hypothetical protein